MLTGGIQDMTTILPLLGTELSLVFQPLILYARHLIIEVTDAPWGADLLWHHQDSFEAR
jgi:hypothetical protein